MRNSVARARQLGRFGALAGVITLVVSAALPLVTLARTPNSTRAPLTSVPGRMIPVRAGRSPDVYRPILAPGTSTTNGLRSNTLANTSTIAVTYHGFKPAAQAAFQAAVNVWQTIVVSDQVIHVDATWKNLGSTGILGQASATNLWLESDGGGTFHWFPAAIHEARCHCNDNAGAEISADFNSAFPDWYKGTDGNVPNGEWDLETVVLHELGHGLGFFSSFNAGFQKGYWGIRTGGANPSNYALRFDAMEWDKASGGSHLTTYSPNGVTGTTFLKTQLTDGGVFFGEPGSHVEALLGVGHRARLYAPNPWQSGSSNSHLDEDTYAAGTINALMTPVLNDGEAIHDPGPIVKAILQDIGWTLAGATTVPGAPQTVSATAGDTGADVSWSAPSSNGGSTITGYTVTSSPDGATCTTAGKTACTVSGLSNGVQYSFTVTATNGVGTGPPSAPSNPVVPHAPSSDVDAPVVDTPVVNIVAPQVMSTTATIRVSWPDAPDASGIAAYELQRQAGAGPWTAVTLATPTSTSATLAVTRGSNYSFRVRATDGVGNTGDWTTTTSAKMTTKQETSVQIVYTGSWTRSAVSGSAGGYVFQSSTANDTATFTFNGTSVALVSTVAGNRGIAEITLDGSVVELVDLRAPSKTAKKVVWAPDAALAPGLHNVAIRVTGTTSGTGTRVDVDAFLVWP